MQRRIRKFGWRNNIPKIIIWQILFGHPLPYASPIFIIGQARIVFIISNRTIFATRNENRLIEIVDRDIAC